MTYMDLQPSGYDQTSVSIDMHGQPMMQPDNNNDGFKSVVLPENQENMARFVHLVYNL